jgi:hypothetical protein
MDVEARTREVAATLIGLDEATANTAAEEAGMMTRVMSRDGRRLSRRADRRFNRINLSIEKGTVVATSVG